MKLTNKDVKKLKEKGVDPSVILDLLLEEDEAPEDQKPEDQKPEDQKPEDQKPEDQKPEDQKPKDQKPEEQKPDQKNDIQDQILKAIQKLTGAVQSSNLLNAGSNGPDVDTTEAALASIINPTGGNK